MKEKRAWNIWIANDSRAEDQLDWEIKAERGWESNDWQTAPGKGIRVEPENAA